MDGALKKKTITEVQPVLLSPMVDQLTQFVQVNYLKIIQQLFNTYGAIEEIDLEENAVKMMGPYDNVEPLSQLTKQLEKGEKYAHAGG